MKQPSRHWGLTPPSARNGRTSAAGRQLRGPRQPSHSGRRRSGPALSAWLCRDLPGRHRACPIINQFRRQLVEQGEMDPLLQATFEDGAQVGQLVRRAEAKRARWTDGLGSRCPTLASAGRAALVRRRLRLLRPPRKPEGVTLARSHPPPRGVDFGSSTTPSGRPAATCGRAGEEGLYSTLAELNVAHDLGL